MGALLRRARDDEEAQWDAAMKRGTAAELEKGRHKRNSRQFVKAGDNTAKSIGFRASPRWGSACLCGDISPFLDDLWSDGVP